MWVNSYKVSQDGHQLLAEVLDSVRRSQWSFSTRIKLLWLLGILVLMPVKISQLPFHLEWMDLWTLMGLPIVLLILAAERQPMPVPYAIPMGLILFASLLSTFGAPSVQHSFIVIVKEIYLYLWFCTVVAVFSSLSARIFRLVLIVWSAVVVCHGLLIIAQFLSPTVWRWVTHLAGGSQVYDHYRSAGLFVDPDKAGSANKASYFQLLGFVPVILASFYRKWLMLVLCLVLFASMLCTGSMGAITALTGGSLVGMTAVAFLNKQNLSALLKRGAQLTIFVAILGGSLLVFSGQSQNYQDHLERIVAGRADRSSEGRFNLWDRGFNAMIERDITILGIGPENFRVIDWQGKQLHNDTIAFMVERGLIGMIGWLTLGMMMVYRSIYLLRIYHRYACVERSHIEVAVFLAAIAASMAESLTHQVFHTQQLWLVLALQEAMIARIKRFDSHPIRIVRV